ncbi:short subunit dehydrogenase-like uncharacterized protein [Motilibacter peucedani]|uniref:Short subunit dehydrogenase-like uncharacterized protein n=1 Tax=Motilibacter peucedani TaxID=598650 RepID=A0A420XQ59_9ACTN|nr:saccharopine dehydrogenase NADP-binding domain-containing protein [Motilibacter peucedani]RKS75423.1 short subunit dehydrogenase-like uncharacterized protein [Motilibacter peucedani]
MGTTDGREHDLVLLGASGFVGRLVAGHLARHAPPDLRVALAGRSAQRVGEVRDSLGGPAARWPVLEVDSADDDAVARLARGAAVVVSTVGPYLRHGLPLVRACATAGTHYADVTGEVAFVRRSIDVAHESAVATGARIVHACGFDSVPSDLAVRALAERALADGAGGLTRTQLALVAARGGVSGGTVDSLRTQLDAAAADPAVAQLMGDPYALSPDRGSEPAAGERGLRGPRRDPETGEWLAPFVMAPFNTRVVRRSNALTGWAYGRGLRYSEVVSCGSGRLAPVAAGGLALATGALVAALRLSPTRRVVDRLLPKPGTGPGERTREGGMFRTRTTAHTGSGRAYVAHVAASGDPGYAATAVMLGESALALALDPHEGGGGVLTPATAVGGALTARLRARGFELRVEERP